MSAAGGVRMVLRCGVLSTVAFLRQRSTVVWLVLFPLLLTSVFCFVITAFETDEPCLYVQNTDPDSQAAMRFIDEIGEQIEIVEVDPSLSVDDVRQMMSVERDRIAVGLLIIPADFNDWAVDSLFDNSYRLTVDTGERLIDVEVWKEAAVGTNQPQFVVPKAPEYGESIIDDATGGAADRYSYFFPAVLMAILMQTILGLVIGTRGMMRKANLISVTGNTSQRSWHTAAIQLMWCLVPAAVCTAVSVAVLSFFTQVSVSPWFVPAMVMVSFTVTSMGLLLSTMLRECQNSAIVASAITVPLLMLSGALVPFDFLASWVSDVSVFLPVTYMADAIRASMTAGPDLLRDCLMMAVFTAVSLAVWALIERRLSSSD